jgi:thiol:disulfide interchange protein DsbC
MSVNSVYRLLAVVGFLSAANCTLAAEPAKPAAKGEDIRVQLAKKLPGAKPEDVRTTPIAGMYEITLGSSTAYISADGKYLISGDLYDIASKTNLTEDRRAESRIRSLATVKDADLIAFGPMAAKHNITVFIDVDCGYCRKLHSEIAELNKLGVRVRYAAYPRSGPGTESWTKMEAVWCAKDRRDALTRSQLGEDVGSPKCGATPVASQYRLGDEMGVNGTPAIYTEAGQYIGGYMPPQQLLAQLDELKAEVATAKGRP